MASESQTVFAEVNVDDVVAKAVEEFKKVIGDEHVEDLLDEGSGIVKDIRKQAENDAQLHRKLIPLEDKFDLAELETVMSTVLSAEEMQIIKDTFLFHTYRVQVYTCSNPVTDSYVKFLREGEEFVPDIKLVSSSDIVEAKWMQWTSIVIEIFMLVLSAVGIKIALNARKMEKVTKSVGQIVKMPAFQKALLAFKSAWSRGGAGGRSKAIFDFLKNSYSGGFFWKIAKSIISQMSWWDYARAIATCTAMIAAAFATGGIVLIAKIALSLNSAYELVKKMVNLEALDKIEEERNEIALKSLSL